MTDRSLLAQVQGLIERTYRLRARLDAGRFVIGDSGYRLFYREQDVAETVSAAGGDGARTLVRETPSGPAASIYFPDAMIRVLERHPPQRGLGDANVDAFATLVEELDHLLCLADGVVRGRPVSLFELELHANVSKHLVLSRFLAGRRPALTESDRVWLRFHLFEKFAFSDRDPAVRARYRDAARWAIRMLDGLGRVEAVRRLAVLRRFHRASAGGKVALIRGLAA